MEQHQDAQTARKKIDIEAISARISSEPPPPKELTKRDAVEALRPALVQALAAGHTAVSLSALLLKDDLKVGARTLALWLNAPGSTASKLRTRKRAKATAT